MLLSLRKKLLFSVGLLIVLSLGSSTAIHIQELKRYYLESLSVRVEALSHNFFTRLENAQNMGLANPKSVFSSLSLECMTLYDSYKDRDVTHVAVLAASGEIGSHNDSKLWNAPIESPALLAHLKHPEKTVILDNGIYHTLTPMFLKDATYLGSIDIGISKRMVDQQIQMMLLQTGGLFIGLLGVTGATVGVVITRLVTTPVQRLMNSMQAFEQGNFGEQVPIFRQKDEIGDLADAFQEMQARVAAVVHEVKTAAQDVAQRSREMSAAAEQMSEGASQQASATEEVSASMQEMAANIHQTAENARLTEGMAVASAEDARAGRQAVTEIIQAMEVIADRISVVQEIASQTNMLSLNATIEASKAQDFGKGFSVVASSVRDLARQSRAAADEIRTLVHSCVVLSAQAGAVLQRLVPNSEKTAELVQEINAASQEQSTGVEHVNQAVQQLDTVTQHTAATAEEVATTAESLTTQADALQQAMAFFTVNEVKTVAMPTKTTELLQSLGLDKQQLVALLTTLTAEDAPAPHAARPSRPSEAAAVKPPSVLPLKQASRAADEMDQEFEHF